MRSELESYNGDEPRVPSGRIACTAKKNGLALVQRPDNIVVQAIDWRKPEACP